MKSGADWKASKNQIYFFTPQTKIITIKKEFKAWLFWKMWIALNLSDLSWENYQNQFLNCLLSLPVSFHPPEIPPLTHRSNWDRGKLWHPPTPEFSGMGSDLEGLAPPWTGTIAWHLSPAPQLRQHTNINSFIYILN